MGEISIVWSSCAVSFATDVVDETFGELGVVVTNP